MKDWVYIFQKLHIYSLLHERNALQNIITYNDKDNHNNDDNPKDDNQYSLTTAVTITKQSQY